MNLQNEPSPVALYHFKRENELCRESLRHTRNNALLPASIVLLMTAAIMQIPSPIHAQHIGEANLHYGILQMLYKWCLTRLQCTCHSTQETILNSFWEVTTVATLISAFMTALRALKVYETVRAELPLHLEPAAFAKMDELAYCTILKNENDEMLKLMGTAQPLVRRTMTAARVTAFFGMSLAAMWAIFGGLG